MTSYSILIADQEKASADFVRNTLVADGYATNFAESSKEAIRSATLTQPQLLLINPAMLNPSGIDAARKIQLDTKCKVLFLTPLADESYFCDVLAGLQKQGCESSALRVPCSATELLARVRIEAGPARPFTPIVRSERLLAMMRPGLYAMNAFRVASLDISAFLEDPACSPGTIEYSQKTDAYGQIGDVFDLRAPSAEELPLALQSLQIPEHRLLQALFWFWPISPTNQADGGLLALQRGEPQVAEAFWTAYASGQHERESMEASLDARRPDAEQALLQTRKRDLSSAKAISIHNLAVLHHLYALRWETAARADRMRHSTERLSEWKKAFAFWSQLRDDHCLLELFPARTGALYQTWLTTFGQMIWHSLPLALLSINAEMATRAIEEQNFDAALEQRQIMKDSAFGPERVTQALHGCLRPLTEKLTRLCENAEASSRANPGSGYPSVRGLLLEANRYLRGVRCLLDTGDPMRAAAHDRVAQSARTCLWACANRTQDWQVAQPLFQQCFTLAESNSLRFSLRQDLETVADKISAQQDRSRSSFASQVEEQHNAQKRVVLTRSLVVLLTVGLLVLFAPLVRRAFLPASITAQTQTSATQAIPVLSPAAPPSSPQHAPSLVASPPQRPAAAPTVDLSAQRKVIVHNVEQLRGMEPALLNMKERLAALQYGLTASKVSVDDRISENVAEQRKSSLAAYNSLMSDYIAMLQRYESLAQSTNAQIGNYNSQVGAQPDRLPAFRTKW